jgi:hypothetical protein
MSRFFIQPLTGEVLISRLVFWRSERRWERKQSQMFREADTVVVAHTKSGQTWLRVMLSHIFHLRYGLPSDELIQFDNFHLREPRIPKIHFTRDNRFLNLAGKTLASPSFSQRLLFLVRDPRDTAVSFWYHVKHRAKNKELYLKQIARSARKSDLFDFAMDERCGIDMLIQLFNRWLKESADFPHVHFTRYEDLRADTSTELRAILQFIGVTASSEEIDRAVSFASFENMKRLEQEKFFKSDRLGATVPGNPDSMKVRAGKVAGYAKLLSSPERDRLNSIVGERLDSRFGYGADPLLSPANLPRDGLAKQS